MGKLRWKLVQILTFACWYEKISTIRYITEIQINHWSCVSTECDRDLPDIAHGYLCTILREIGEKKRKFWIFAQEKRETAEHKLIVQKSTKKRWRLRARKVCSWRPLHKNCTILEQLMQSITFWPERGKMQHVQRTMYNLHLCNLSAYFWFTSSLICKKITKHFHHEMIIEASDESGVGKISINITYVHKRQKNAVWVLFLQEVLNNLQNIWVCFTDAFVGDINGNFSTMALQLNPRLTLHCQ